MRYGHFPGGGFAAMAIGIAAAAVATRLLPPLMAQMAGQARASAGADPFQELVDDHRKFVALLTEMEASADDAVFSRTQHLLRLKRRLAAHAMAEENVLYPALDEQGEAVGRLYDEHGQIKMHLYALEQMDKGGPRWAERVRALRILLEAHARQEEEIEFPRLRAALDARRKSKLAGGLLREKAMVL
jgi:hemerythrin superfamily protein